MDTDEADHSALIVGGTDSSVEAPVSYDEYSHEPSNWTCVA